MDNSETSSLINEQLVPNYQHMSVWHWLITVGTALGTILTGIIPHSFGTFIAYFKSSFNNTHNPSLFNATQFQFNWLPALSSAFPCILLPLFAFIVHRLNRSYQTLSVTGFIILGISCGLSSLVNTWTTLFFTYSFLYSLGSSLYLAVTIIILAEYFPADHKFHILATSLFQIGYPAAALVGNPVLAVIIVNYGWKTAFKSTSLAIVLFGVVISCLMKPIREKGFCKYIEERPEALSTISNETYILSATKRSFSTTSLNYFVTTYEMWPWLIGKFINYMCWYGLRTNIVTYLVKSTTFGLAKSATLMSTYAGAEIVVALIASLCGDKFRGKLIHIHIIAALVMALLTGIYTMVITSYLSAVIIMICIGIPVQFSLSFGYPASVEVLRAKFDMKTGWIFTNVAAGLGILASPFFSGILMDNFGVNSLMYSQCCGWIVQSILFILTLVIMKKNEKDSQADYQDAQSKK